MSVVGPELLTFCRARGFGGDDPAAALAWLQARVGVTAPHAPSPSDGAPTPDGDGDTTAGSAATAEGAATADGRSTAGTSGAGTALGSSGAATDRPSPNPLATAVFPLGRAPDAPIPDDDAPVLPDRYERLGQLGVGGMGVVLRVRDRLLDRSVAMKILRAELSTSSGAADRFFAEARATARLQHPGIIPVHDYGTLPDGRAWFTMREVHGRTLGEVIAEVHAAGFGPASVSPSGWTFRRLVDAFLRVCEAVGYAHEQGLLHRDLKPANVMVGAHGEVLVLDWGLAKAVGSSEAAWRRAGRRVADDRAELTRLGEVAGTPAYMAPEQARGDAVDARSDVYALGAMLYAILAGRAPYTGASADAIVLQVLRGPPPPLRPPLAEPTLGFAQLAPGAAHPEPVAALDAGLPQELVDACTTAMARLPGERFPDADTLARAVGAWLDGARRAEQALAVLDAARRRRPEAEALRARAAALRADADTLLADVPVWAEEARKALGWALQDEAAALEHQADVALLEEEQLLAAALTHAPGLPEAHAALAARYRDAHAAAERDGRDATRPELLLRTHVQALPAAHPDRARHAAYLRGDGALTLHTDPPGAEVLLHRYELRNRRLEPVFLSAHHAPLEALPLPLGSYLCVLRHPGRAEVRYPVHIGRGEHWDGAPPDAADPLPIRLPLPGELGPDDVYVPAGWFRAGGDPDAMTPVPRRRLWCDAFVIRRFSVTNAEYITFLDDLAARSGLDEALRWVPRDRNGGTHLAGAPVYGHGPDGGFFLKPDADGDLWEPQHAVSLVDWPGANAYAGWLAARDGLPWQLAHELAWEKAARGVDGRFFPWGNRHDPSWACMRSSHGTRPVPPHVDSFPVDTSVYGMRGASGGSREWCVDVFLAEGPPCPGDRVDRAIPAPAPSRLYRGGGWYDVERYTRLATRGPVGELGRDCTLGFRILRWL